MNEYKQDLLHILVNLPLSMVCLVYYPKFGFERYGWRHVLFLATLQYVLPLDNWIDGERGFPYYILPVIALSFWSYPTLFILSLGGTVVVNLREIFGVRGLIYERLEALGNFLILVMPMLVPIMWYAPLSNAILYVLFMDAFHKIGHRETISQKWTWISGLIFYGAVVILFVRGALHLLLCSIATISFIPFYLMRGRPRKYTWAYFQLWQVVACWVGFGYLLYGGGRIGI